MPLRHHQRGKPATDYSDSRLYLKTTNLSLGTDAYNDLIQQCSLLILCMSQPRNLIDLISRIRRFAIEKSLAVEFMSFRERVFLDFKPRIQRTSRTFIKTFRLQCSPHCLCSPRSRRPRTCMIYRLILRRLYTIWRRHGNV